MNDDRFLEFFVVGSQLNAHSSRPFLRLGLTNLHKIRLESRTYLKSTSENYAQSPCLIELAICEADYWHVRL